MSEFEQWLIKNMPSGTVIGDPKWWASKILQAAKQSMQGEVKFDLSACLSSVADMGFWPQVIYDDNGNWAIWDEGSSNMRLDDDMDYHCSFLIPAEYFKPSLHDAWSSYVEKLKQLGNDVSELYTHAPDSAARISELEAENEALRKDADAFRKIVQHNMQVVVTRKSDSLSLGITDAKSTASGTGWHTASHIKDDAFEATRTAINRCADAVIRQIDASLNIKGGAE